MSESKCHLVNLVFCVSLHFTHKNVQLQCVRVYLDSSGWCVEYRRERYCRAAQSILGIKHSCAHHINTRIRDSHCRQTRTCVYLHLSSASYRVYAFNFKICVCTMCVNSESEHARRIGKVHYHILSNKSVFSKRRSRACSDKHKRICRRVSNTLLNLNSMIYVCMCGQVRYEGKS